MYHIACPVKYSKKVFSKDVEKSLKKVYKGIYQRYEIHFIEIGTDEDHVHFLVQSVRMHSPKKIVNTIKSITEIKIFKLHTQK